jgi:hypothetical protein
VLIAATNRDLAKAVAGGTFRQDLYYRLNVFPVALPPLGQPDDIPLLVHYFVARYAAKIGRKITRVPEASMRRLRDYAWPGNVRELENVIERAVILSAGPDLDIAAEVLPASAPAPAAVEVAVAEPVPATGTLEQVERGHILATLKKTNWRIDGPNGAARILDLNPSTLRSRMQKLEYGGARTSFRRSDMSRPGQTPAADREIVSSAHCIEESRRFAAAREAGTAVALRTSHAADHGGHDERRRDGPSHRGTAHAGDGRRAAVAPAAARRVGRRLRGRAGVRAPARRRSAAARSSAARASSASSSARSRAIRRRTSSRACGAATTTPSRRSSGSTAGACSPSRSASSRTRPTRATRSRRPSWPPSARSTASPAVRSSRPGSTGSS